jgi:hypothetical protein
MPSVMGWSSLSWAEYTVVGAAAVVGEGDRVVAVIGLDATDTAAVPPVSPSEEVLGGGP